jgi:hypothetical protein
MSGFLSLDPFLGLCHRLLVSVTNTQLLPCRLLETSLLLWVLITVLPLTLQAYGWTAHYSSPRFSTVSWGSPIPCPIVLLNSSQIYQDESANHFL